MTDNPLDLRTAKYDPHEGQQSPGHKLQLHFPMEAEELLENLFGPELRINVKIDGPRRFIIYRDDKTGFRLSRLQGRIKANRNGDRLKGIEKLVAHTLCVAESAHPGRDCLTVTVAESAALPKKMNRRGQKPAQLPLFKPATAEVYPAEPAAAVAELPSPCPPLPVGHEVVIRMADGSARAFVGVPLMKVAEVISLLKGAG